MSFQTGSTKALQKQSIPNKEAMTEKFNQDSWAEVKEDPKTFLHKVITKSLGALQATKWVIIILWYLKDSLALDKEMQASESLFNKL